MAMRTTLGRWNRTLASHLACSSGVRRRPVIAQLAAASIITMVDESNTQIGVFTKNLHILIINFSLKFDKNAGASTQC